MYRYIESTLRCGKRGCFVGSCAYFPSFHSIHCKGDTTAEKHIGTFELCGITECSFEYFFLTLHRTRTHWSLRTTHNSINSHG